MFVFICRTLCSVIKCFSFAPSTDSATPISVENFFARVKKPFGLKKLHEKRTFKIKALK